MTFRYMLASFALALLGACGGESQGGGNTGGGGGSGAFGGSGGSDGGTTCAELAQQYKASLDEAKSCESSITSKQCLELVDTELACPCDTYVNAANALAVQALKDLKTAWGKASCATGQICGVCKAVDGADCQPGATGAHGCYDFGLE